MDEVSQSLSDHSSIENNLLLAVVELTHLSICFTTVCCGIRTQRKVCGLCTKQASSGGTGPDAQIWQCCDCAHCSCYGRYSANDNALTTVTGNPAV